jgi:Ser/Thr protein kinase RdoA (MazF antagonist)
MLDNRAAWRSGQPRVSPQSQPSHQALFSYLIETGLAEAASLRLGGKVVDLSRCHGVWLVTPRGGQRLIVKQARPRSGDLHANLGAELVVYQLAVRCPELRAVMPRCLWQDSRRQMLVLEAIEPGESLNAHSYRLGPAKHFAHRLGVAVAGWHRATHGRMWGYLSPATPWILGIFSPGCWRPRVSERLLTTGSLRHELARHFARLSAGLRPSCLVHGDLKWDNCLVNGKADAVNAWAGGLKVIDWEMASIGDPAWDVAGIVQDYIVYQAAQGAQASGTSAAAAASLHVFLEAYVEAARVPDSRAFRFWVIRLAGARLVQTAFEQATAWADERMPKMLIERARAILRDPAEFLRENGGFS